MSNVAVRTFERRAWPGDVKTSQLDISKIMRRGWDPRRNSEEAIRAAVEELVRELGMRS